MADLDIVIPLYKSKASVALLVSELSSWIISSGLKVRVILVDDGSADGTFEELIALTQNVSFEKLCIKLAKNYGQHTATAIGFSHTTAKLIATIDDDLQHNPFELDALLSKLSSENADLVYGTYRKKKHSIVRNIGSNLLKRILRSEGRNYAYVTSFRLMKSNVISNFKDQQLPVIFVDEYLLESAANYSFCEIEHSERNNGNSSYSSWKLIKLATNILLFHSSIPLKLITRFGLFMSFIFFLLGCYYIYEKMFNDVQLGFTSIIVAIFFSTGMILLSLGIIGEYIRKIWNAQHQLDKVIIREKC